jgi:hypothetical protein
MQRDYKYCSWQMIKSQKDNLPNERKLGTLEWVIAAGVVLTSIALGEYGFKQIIEYFSR